MANEDQYTPEQIRTALSRSVGGMEPHQAAAVELLLNHNHGRLVEEPRWLHQFVAMGASGKKAGMRWSRLVRALSEADDVPRDLTEAVQPYSDTDRSVMRFAADLGSERWAPCRWDARTRAEVTKSFAAALQIHLPYRSGGVTNSITGSTQGTTLQTGNFYSNLDLR